ncbi:MAG: DUF3037 domain-containing protein [Saprospiraceae bacterium]
MKTYQYQVVKYVHDHFTGEFINVGVIIYAPDFHYLGSKFSSRSKRITQFFPDAEGRKIIQLLQEYEKEVARKATLIKEIFQPSPSLEEITASILPVDGSVIQYSKVKTGLTLDFDQALSDLYLDLVDKYVNEKHTSSMSDEDVWKLKYKNYFDKAGLTDKLQKHVVKTKSDNFEFDKAWKNGIWHCYEPLSLELQTKDNIKDKVYRWAGKIQGIKQAEEKINLTLLTSLNPNYTNLKPFIREYLKSDLQNIEVDLVFEEEIPQAMQRITSLIKEHDSNSK